MQILTFNPARVSRAARLKTVFALTGVVFSLWSRLPAHAQQPDPLTAAALAHGGSALESVVRIQMVGTSSNGQAVTISAALAGVEAPALRLDYGQPVTASYINTPLGAIEAVAGRPVVFRPPHVGAFAQLDMLSSLLVGKLAAPSVTREVLGSTSVQGRTAARVRAATGQNKAVFRRTIDDEVEVRLDEETGTIVEVVRRLLSEGSMDVSFQAGFRFADYRQVQGIRLPFQIERVLDGVLRETITLSEITLNPPLSAAFFEPPPKRNPVPRRNP